MAKIFAELKSRVIGSPVSTLWGALVSAGTILLHMASVNVDWAQTRQVVITGVSSAIPLVIGALVKAAPKMSPVAQDLTAKMTLAITTAAELAAAAATDKVIAEIQKLAAIPAPKEEEKTA